MYRSLPVTTGTQRTGGPVWHVGHRRPGVGQDGRVTDAIEGHPRGTRGRMSGKERRAQLVDVGRALFAEKGLEGTSVEEIAAKAGVSKPVVYEHFGGKEGLYAVVVDREMQRLLDGVTGALTGGHPRELLEQAAFALLDYIDTNADGFSILVRDSGVGTSTGTFTSLISDIATQVEHILGSEFKARGFDPKFAPMYSQMLVGMVALTGQWWLDAQKPKREEVAAHLVNLAWNGLSGMEQKPRLSTDKRDRPPA
jgi:AcrR family transcriptional regulator